jgi:hypothetical protein
MVPLMESRAKGTGMKSGSSLLDALTQPQLVSILKTEVVEDLIRVESRSEETKESAELTVFEPQATKSTGQANEIPLHQDTSSAPTVTETKSEQAVRLSTMLKPILFLAGILLGTSVSVRYTSHRASVPCPRRSLP